MFKLLRKLAGFKEYVVHASWDKEAGVWVATSDDIPGLVTEAETQQELISKLEVMVPEILQENVFSKRKSRRLEVPVSLLYQEQHLKLRIAH